MQRSFGVAGRRLAYRAALARGLDTPDSQVASSVHGIDFA